MSMPRWYWLMMVGALAAGIIFGLVVFGTAWAMPDSSTPAFVGPIPGSEDWYTSDKPIEYFYWLNGHFLSQPLIHCPNDRQAHLKFPMDTWRHCDTPSGVSIWTALDFVPDTLKQGDVLFYGKMLDYKELGPSPHTLHCKGHWRVPIFRCPPWPPPKPQGTPP